MHEKGATMTKKSLSRAGEGLGFLIFTIGATGLAVAMAVAMMTESGSAGRDWLLTWSAASLLVAVAGAMIGSISEATAPPEPRKSIDHLTAPVATSAPPLAAQPALPVRAQHETPHVATFRRNRVVPTRPAPRRDGERTSVRPPR